MRRALKLPALTLALVLTLSSPISAPDIARAATAADAAAAQKRADEARRKAAVATDAAAKLEAEAQAYDAEIEAARIQVASIQPQKDAAVARADQLRTEVSDLETEVESLRGEMSDVQERYEEKKADLADRVNALYRQGSFFLLEFVLTAKDMDDFLSRTEFAQRVLHQNSEAALALDAEYKKLADVEAKLGSALDTLRVRKSEAEAVENEILALDATYRGTLTQLENLQASKNSALEQMLKDARYFQAAAAAEDAAARKILSELSDNTGTGVISGGILAWPVPSSSRITSGYGMRTLNGKTAFHNAIDIGAPSGSAVVAANNGRVLKASYAWNGGYGNTIWIDHGQGVITCYNHLSSISVSVGAQVQRGQRIGAVGSTGYSTGPHLDFQVIVNGAFKNPMEYLR